MKITFINPPQTKSKYKFLGVVAPPMGIAYMAAIVEKNNYDVNIIDASALDLEMEELETKIKERNPDIIAITALTPTIKKAIETGKIAKKVAPNSKIIMGGYHPSFNYKETLENDCVDIIIRGEGELTILNLVKAIENKEPLNNIKGIVYKENGKIIVNPSQDIIENLDELPFPALHLLPMDKYKILNMATNIATMITSRGCPIQCSFCCSAALHGEKIRSRSTKNIVDEMEYHLKNYNIDTIAFMDDTFTINKKKVREICNEILHRNLKVWWGCTSRVDTLDEDLLNLMKKAGCITIFMGVESADQQTLNKMNKNITVEKTKKAFELSNKIGIRTIASVVIGMPKDTKDNIKKTIDFVFKLKPSYAIYSLATPYPGTRFYKESIENNLIKVKDWSKYTLTSPIFETIDCSMRDVKWIQKMAFIKFYLRPSYLIKQIKQDGIVLFKTIFGVLKQLIKKDKN